MNRKASGATANPGAKVLGAGDHRYEAIPEWEQLPNGWRFIEVGGVATDSQDRVYVFNRGEHPVIVFDSEGHYLDSWGQGQFVRPHGICIGPDDAVYLTDDQDHTVRKCAADGRLEWKLGTSRQPSDTGLQGLDYRTLKRSGAPFNHPTNLAVAPDGCLYVTDGYGNARVHKFSPAGQLLMSWGEPGSGPGEFNVPHGIAIDNRGRVIVADRENSRLQFFTAAGQFLEIWSDVIRPCEVFVDAADHILVAELGRRTGMFPWMTPDLCAPGGRVSIFDSAGRLVARWGGGNDPKAPNDFFAPHDLWQDGKGNLYVGEVVVSACGASGPGGANYPCLRKFRLVAPR